MPDVKLLARSGRRRYLPRSIRVRCLGPSRAWADGLSADPALHSQRVRPLATASRPVRLGEADEARARPGYGNPAARSRARADAVPVVLWRKCDTFRWPLTDKLIRLGRERRSVQ